MAATFHVFVDGAVDGSAGGLQSLATAMASRYGLQPADLVARLAKGRFRVKANADKAMADKVAADLRSIGARVVVEEATAANAQTGPVPKQPAAPPAPAAPAAPKPPPSALPPRTTGQVPKPGAASTTGQVPKAAGPGSALSNVARTTAPPQNAPTGLAAAFSSDTAKASLGALEDGAFSLAALDGAEDTSPPPRLEAAPPPSPASSAHAAPAAKALDLFAPPDMQAGEAELKFDLSPEEEARHSAKRASIPPANVPAAPPPAAPGRGSQPLPVEAPRAARSSLQPPNTAATPTAAAPRSIGGLNVPAEWKPRARFAAGVVLAIVLGFIPAHFVASMRQASEYKAIDDHVTAVQSAAADADSYAALDTFRADQINRKISARRNAAFLAFFIWALAGAGIAFVYFRKVPWTDDWKDA